MKDKIIIKGARQHNLKNIDVSIPRNTLTVITGLSGSGKSSLAFDTIYAEGQRKYVESLSSYVRQFLGLMQKPDVDTIEGLSPAISIEQKSTSKNPRSTVGTVTEIYDYLRLLYARIGIQHCNKCEKLVSKQTLSEIAKSIMNFKKDDIIYLMAPIIKGKKGEFSDLLSGIAKKGFMRVRIDGKNYRINACPKLHKNKKHSIEVIVDRIKLDNNINERLSNSLEIISKMSNGEIIVNNGKSDTLFSENYSCSSCNISYEPLEPTNFSFNSPYGACNSCDGLGTKTELDIDKIIPDKRKSLIDGAIAPIRGNALTGKGISQVIKKLFSDYNISYTTPWESINQEIKDILINGVNIVRRKNYYNVYNFEGIIPNLRRRYLNSKSQYIRDWIEQYMSQIPCPKCNGMKLNKSSLSVFIKNHNIIDLTKYSVESLFDFFKSIKLNKTDSEIAKPILKEIKERLSFLNNVGVGYLSLFRSARTLSGGEAQRIRLATQIGSQLTGVLYVLDEPSIGLHQRDNAKLIKTLQSLKNIGNTVIVVEHDEETMQSADWIIDIGPKAGVYGGKVIASGSPKQIMQNKKSITGQYLSKNKKIEYNKKRRKGSGKNIVIKGASGNNLKKIDCSFPIGKLICVTGVSGSGKSTLIKQTLYPAMFERIYANNSFNKSLPFTELKGLRPIDKVILIDQSPIGKTPRSNPATYTGLFTHIRELYSNLNESKIRGYKPGRFSFNVKGGRCEKCQGAGLIKIEMYLLPDIYINCDECNGRRFNSDTLDITYKGKNIFQILDMTIDEATSFFKNHKSINRKLQTLLDVGLGYIKLGQSSTTLSGGEAQRIKLSSELSRVITGRSVYMLDEPTTGLHFEDIRLLLSVLNNLVNRGNTVIVIEHNMDIIKSSDWVIDIGPEGGDSGGQIIAVGAPEEIIKNKKSETGKYLIKYLD
ncbi:MAG: excinuclease ABC subunit A [Candidatus Marinimicrobia bacterium]|nr:excinuclease ABC subunit A [Candidatus Neomarinimicrobiota bacterium]